MSRMKFSSMLVATLALLMAAGSLASAKSPKKGKLLYMTLTKGYHHESVELSKQIVKEIGDKSGAWETTTTEDVGAFTKENLKNQIVTQQVIQRDEFLRWLPGLAWP